MPKKIIEVTGIGPVEFVRRRTARSIRISINEGITRVSLPFWTPYAAAVAFVASKTDWVNQHAAHEALQTITAGQAVGKAHRISFVPGPSIGSRIKGNAIIISYPVSLSSDNHEVQQKARQAAMRALRKEAEQLLPARTKTLAEQHGYDYGTISVKQLKRRWGSCDQQGNLTYNLFLMQLPWDLIDYVILHELNHTVHMNHSAAFWSQLGSILEDLPSIRKRMRAERPVIGA